MPSPASPSTLIGRRHSFNLEHLNDCEVFAVIRRRSGLHQAPIAKLAGVHQARISMWERGTQVLPSSTVDRLWAALDELLEERAGTLSVSSVA